MLVSMLVLRGGAHPDDDDKVLNLAEDGFKLRCPNASIPACKTMMARALDEEAQPSGNDTGGGGGVQEDDDDELRWPKDAPVETVEYQRVRSVCTHKDYMPGDWKYPQPPCGKYVYVFSDPRSDLNEWVNARTLREWQRWYALADEATPILPAPTHVLVPIELSALHQSEWAKVLVLCERSGHRCHLDSLAKELDEIRYRCQCCADDGTHQWEVVERYLGACDSSGECIDCVNSGGRREALAAREVQCKRCVQDIPLREALKTKGQDPMRNVTAWVSRKHISP